jgi:hypothetical protein
MPALGAGIYVFLIAALKTWMAGTSPAMTEEQLSEFNPDLREEAPLRPKTVTFCRLNISRKSPEKLKPH